MNNQKEIIEKFYDLCDGRVTISLRDGTYYEGYMFEIFDDKVTFFIGGPLAPDEPIEIPINDIDLDSLCFYSDRECKWKSAIWKDETNDWEIKDFILKEVREDI